MHEMKFHEATRSVSAMDYGRRVSAVFLSRTIRVSFVSQRSIDRKQAWDRSVEVPR
jgi:hypothetical protein